MYTETSETAAIEQAYTSSPLIYLLRGIVLVGLSYRSTIGKQVRFFAGNLSRKHLEVPCGNGAVLDFVLKEFGYDRIEDLDITGIDVAREMLPDAVRQFEAYPNVRCQYGNVAAMDFDDRTFRTVNVPNGLHCFPDPVAALSEIRRVLVPGGVVAANVLLHPRGNVVARWAAERVNAWGQRNDLLQGPFEAEEVLELFHDAGFLVTEQEVHGNTLYLEARRPDEPAIG
jgi:ubiquinone/menaquinone biosynthesis C-methylase UbiE